MCINQVPEQSEEASRDLKEYIRKKKKEKRMKKGGPKRTTLDIKRK